MISTTFNWNSENATLTLVANFNEIIFEFIQQTNLTNVHIADVLNSPVDEDEEKYRLERHVVLIQSAGLWGTGCFVKINNTRVIITCAHVINQVNSVNNYYHRTVPIEQNLIAKHLFLDYRIPIKCCARGNPVNSPVKSFLKIHISIKHMTLPYSRCQQMQTFPMHISPFVIQRQPKLVLY